MKMVSSRGSKDNERNAVYNSVANRAAVPRAPQSHVEHIAEHRDSVYSDKSLTPEQHAALQKVIEQKRAQLNSQQQQFTQPIPTLQERAAQAQQRRQPQAQQRTAQPQRQAQPQRPTQAQRPATRAEQQRAVAQSTQQWSRQRPAQQDRAVLQTRPLEHNCPRPTKHKETAKSGGATAPESLRALSTTRIGQPTDTPAGSANAAAEFLRTQTLLGGRYAGLQE